MIPVTDANSKNIQENTAKVKCEYRQKERVIDVNVFWKLLFDSYFKFMLLRALVFINKSAYFYFYADLFIQKKLDFA
jgi:hypothetical protein